MYTLAQLEQARNIASAAFSASMLADAMEFHRFMDHLCLASAKVCEEQGYDDASYFTYHEIRSIEFDTAKLTAKGGLDYLKRVLSEEFNTEISDDDSLDDVLDFLNSNEFLNEEPVSDMSVDLGDVVRINSHNEVVEFDELTVIIQKTIDEDLPALTEKLQGIAA
ncbi:hypothetical protein [Rheinheimera sp.]|uniref:hypothetical protein n=1 Tax=Rheinheimera sp. TaxID=1869214 RepID=UPI004048C806